MRKEASSSHSQRTECQSTERRKKWGHECALYNNSVSYFQAEFYWFVYWRWWKTHFMDSNKPLCLLNTQINYRLRNQNYNLFSLLWTDTQFCLGWWRTNEPQCSFSVFQSLDIKEHYDNKGWIEFSLSMSVCKETLFFILCHGCFMFFIHLLPKSVGMQLSSLLYFTIIHLFWPQRGQTWLNILCSEKHKHPVTIRLGEQANKNCTCNNGCMKFKQTLD